MNMRELAQLTGVSVSTVSKAFSGSREVSAQQREYIFRVAKENGCFGKYNKIQFEKPVIAVIGPEFQSHYYAHHLTLLEKEIQKHGALMVSACYNFDKNVAVELAQYFIHCAKVSGIISYEPQILKAQNNLPTVVIGRSDVYDSIALSWDAPMVEAITYLMENGHKRIAFIGEKLTKTKDTAFIRAMQKCALELPKEYIVESERRFEEAGYEDMNQLLALPQPPTAVIAGYDHIAIGAMKSIYEHGLKIPDDISMIGMDDLNTNPYFEVPLTSITSYNSDLCEIAVNMIFERIENGAEAKKRKVSVSGELIKRDSVGPAKEIIKR